MIKYIGIILTSGAISLYGAFASSKVKSAAKHRKALIELLYAIKSGIEYGGVSLDEIFCTFENSTLEKCGFISILRSPSPNAFENALECENLLISETEKALFCEFAKKCGKSYYTFGEQKLCERYIALAEAQDKKLCADENAKCTLYKRLGVLCGLLFAIILL